MEIFAISGLINGFVSLVMGAFILYRNYKSKFNWLYFSFSMTVFWWATAYWFWLESAEYDTALFWSRVFVMGSLFAPVAFLHWVVTFLKVEKENKKIIILGYLVAFFLLPFSFTDFLVSGLHQELFFKFWPIPGPLYIFYFYYFITFALYAIYLLLRGIKLAKDREFRAQIIYVSIGAILGYGGTVSNFFLWWDIPIAPYGNLLVSVYAFFMVYAILKFHLFEIKLIASDMFTFLILAFLFVRTLLTQDLTEFILNGLMFVVVMFAGVFLTRSILKEVKQKEELEVLNKKIKAAYEIEKKAKEEIARAYNLEKEATEKITKTYEVEKKLRQKLEKLNDAKNQFMLATQHYLRTPLTAMMYRLELAFDGQYGEMPEKIKGVFSDLRVSTYSLIRMVNEMLDVSQFQMEKKIEIIKSTMNLGKMISDMVSELKITADSKKISLVFNKPEKPMLINADEQRIKIAIFNVIDNAVKYTGKGGVEINLTEKNKKVLISVKDTGIGITKDDLPELFSKVFERGEEARKKFSLGRGIGLFVAGQIVKAHKGKIWAESEGKNKGSCFYIEIPIDL